MHARALALALHALSLACVAAALGSSGCYIGCDTPWRHPGAHEFGSDIELLAVGGGAGLTSYVALGRAGEIMIAKYEGEAVVVRPPSETRLHAVALHHSDSRLVVVGEQGVILVSDDRGETWSPRASGTTRDLRAIVEWRDFGAQIDLTTREPVPGTRSAPDRMIAVGDGVVVTSLDGETWTVVDEPEGGWGSLRAALATESSIWVVGERGVAWSNNPITGTWVAESLGTEVDLLGVASGHWGSGARELLIAASEDTLFLRAPDEAAWRSITPELDGEIIGLSGGFVLTSKGTVLGVELDGRLERAPIDVDFVPTAIHGERDLVVVVGQGGRGASLAYLPCKGRPLLDAGAWVIAPAIERDDWQIGDRSSSDALDEHEASRWRRAGLDEHASIASFAVHLLELVSLGAPAELVREVQIAMADEVRHAALSFGLARRFADVAQGPGRLPIAASLMARCGDARAIALALFEQGCVGETLAACEAEVDARTHADPRTREVLEVIANDERRHAALAWSTLRWLIERDEGLREPLHRRLRELAGVRRSAIHAATWRELIAPLATRLLADQRSPANSLPGLYFGVEPSLATARTIPTTN